MRLAFLTRAGPSVRGGLVGGCVMFIVLWLSSFQFHHQPSGGGGGGVAAPGLAVRRGDRGGNEHIPRHGGRAECKGDSWFPEPTVPPAIANAMDIMTRKCAAAAQRSARVSQGQRAESSGDAVLMIDAGFNVGQNTDGWLAIEDARYKDKSKKFAPPMCVLGFEANPRECHPPKVLCTACCACIDDSLQLQLHSRSVGLQ